MSIRASVKCTKEEAVAFRGKVWDFLEKEKLPYEKLYTSKKYGGECRVYTGRKIETMPMRRSFKLLAFKNPKGEWEGDLEAVKQFGDSGNSIGVRDYHPKEVPEYFSVYREDDWNEEKTELKNWLLKHK